MFICIFSILVALYINGFDDFSMFFYEIYN